MLSAVLYNFLFPAIYLFFVSVKCSYDTNNGTKRNGKFNSRIVQNTKEYAYINN